MGIPFSRSFAHWHLAACALNDRIYTSKYCNPKTGMCEMCLVSMEWACLLRTNAAVFPCHAELHLCIQCLLTWGRTQNSQVLALIPFPVSAALWSGLQLCCQFIWQIIFKRSHCTCNWCWSCVEVCDTKSILTLIIKLCSSAAQYLTWFVPIYQSFSLHFLSLVSLIYCVNHGQVMEFYITACKFYHFFQAM